METALWYLQKALFARWNSETLLPNVYDYVTADTPKPYITIGEPLVTPSTNKTSYREEMPWTHHVWSDYNGKKEAYDIMNLMLKSLSRTPLEIEGAFYLQNFNVEQLQVITDIDNTTYHGILRVRYFINT